MKSFMPLCIDVSQARIVIIGGGKVALQKLRHITAYASNISVYAKEILPEIKAQSLNCMETAYDPAVLYGARLVYACTNDPELNRRICNDGGRAGALINVADDPENCDFVSPAIFRHEDMSVAISSNGRHVKKSMQWRNAIQKFILNNLV
jgi:precorrin-2 dehydrogenase / sirohydrochlorin ferrochelatase